MKAEFGAERRDRLIIRFTVIFCSLVLVMFALELLPIHGEQAIYDSTIRLHVIANSDTDADQSLKLRVRDAVLEYISRQTENCTSYDDAYNIISADRKALCGIAAKVIENNGYNYNVTVDFGSEDYPTRTYDDIRLPAGRYTSLRINIGSAQGHNWWCVLFPSLCTDSAAARDKLAAAGLSQSQIRILTDNGGKYEVRFRLLELFEKLLGRGQ